MLAGGLSPGKVTYARVKARHSQSSGPSGERGGRCPPYRRDISHGNNKIIEKNVVTVKLAFVA